MLLSLLYICPKFRLFFEALFKLPSPLGESSTTLVPPASRPVLLNPLCFHPGTGLRWPEDACLVHWPWCVRRPHCLCPHTRFGDWCGTSPKYHLPKLFSWPWPSSRPLPVCLATTSHLSFKPQLKLHFLWELSQTSQTQEGVFPCLSFHQHTIMV